MAVWLMQRQVRQLLVIVGLFVIAGQPVPVFATAVAVASALKYGPMATAPLLMSVFGLVGIVGLLAGGFELAMAAAMSAALFMSIALVLAALLRKCGSLTFSLQALVILMVIGISVFTMAVGDVAAFWRDSLTVAIDTLSDRAPQYVGQLVEQGILVKNGSTFELTDMLAASLPFFTGPVAMVLVGTLMVMLLAGYALWDVGCDAAKASFGRFRDLNFGRVLAVTLLVFAVLATFIQSQWMINVAIALLLAFAVHGFALLHWLRHRYQWPVIVLVMAYVLLLGFGSVLAPVMLLFCVVGYVDAWFNLVRATPPGAAH